MLLMLLFYLFYVARMSYHELPLLHLVSLSQAKNKEAEECDWIRFIPAMNGFWTF